MCPPQNHAWLRDQCMSHRHSGNDVFLGFTSVFHLLLFKFKQFRKYLYLVNRVGRLIGEQQTKCRNFEQVNHLYSRLASSILLNNMWSDAVVVLDCRSFVLL